jgi:hypothetical protein
MTRLLAMGSVQQGKTSPDASLASKTRSVQTWGMPLPAIVLVTVVSVGCVLFLAQQVRTLRRRKRNLRHWEKGEPLEGVGDWD